MSGFYLSFLFSLLLPQSHGKRENYLGLEDYKKPLEKSKDKKSSPFLLKAV